MILPAVRRRIARARGSQAGLSLMEVLLVSAISAMIALPVLAWMITGFKTDATVKATSQRTNVTTQLTQMLPRDVSNAAAILYPATDPDATPDADCAGTAATDVIGAVLLVGDPEVLPWRIVVYAATEREERTVIERRECAVGGEVEKRSVLGEAIRALPGEVLTSKVRSADPTPRTVDLTVTLPNSRPVEVSGSIRTGLDPTTTVVAP